MCEYTIFPVLVPKPSDKVLAGVISGVRHQKRGVYAFPSKWPNVLRLDQTAPALTSQSRGGTPRICTAIVWNFRRWTIVLQLYLDAP